MSVTHPAQVTEVTGGVTRSLADKLGEIVSVRDYGAKGDGTTDDAAAIVAADAAIGAGNALYFPAGTYRVASNIATGANTMLVFVGGASLSVDSGKTVTANGRVIALGGDPETGAGTLLLVKDTNLCVNDSGFYFGKLFASGTDSFFVIRRDTPGSTGIIIRNDDITSALTDSYIHLYGGALTGVNQGANLRFSSGNLANNGGLCNIVAQHNAAFSLIQADTAPLDLYTANVRQFQLASVPSAVNYWQFKGGLAASSISLAPAGTDSNISIVYNTKGTGSHFFRTGTALAFQLEVKDTAGAARRVVITGSVSGNPTISASAGSINLAAPAAVTGLSVFANNAAAITGGLAVGNLYRTGADPDVVCVVH